MTTKLSFVDYWPEEDWDHAAGCFFTDADSAPEAVFLAVHQPMTLQKQYYKSSAQPKPQKENDILAALLEPNPKNGTLIIPIIGDSGVGKSHMIRWLDAHLKLRTAHKQRHVVRIPKSASMRRVLDLILEGLDGKKYEDLRKSLQGARLPQTDIAASNDLMSALLTELENASIKAAAQIRDGNATSDARERKTHCSERCLRALISDPQMRGHFFDRTNEDEEKWGVIARIAHRFVAGSKRNMSGERNQFFDEDFAFIEKLEGKQLGEFVKSYVGNLKSTPGSIKKIVRILNEVLEPARARLVEMGEITLSELFNQVRRSLHEDKKELVLLVEDFAVMAGVQQALLDAIIQEAYRDGKQELCVMRTALAVTEGRLSAETVMTRANATWKIESNPFSTEEDAMETYQNFVGAFLNAARWGAEALEKQFKKHKPDDEAADWVADYHLENEGLLNERDLQCLEGFGLSPRSNYPLFPFNASLIRQLARRFLRDGENYRYDPRKLIDNILRGTIIGHRKEFLTSQFPSPKFGDFQFNDLDMDVQDTVQKAYPQEHQRLKVLVYFWGDNPKSKEDVDAMHPFLAKAFGLPDIGSDKIPDLLEDKKDEIKKDEIKKDEIKKDEIKKDEIKKVEIKKVEIKKVDDGPLGPDLERWRQEESIAQTKANAIRNLLVDAITEYIDGNSLLIKKLSISSKDVYLPFVQQGPKDADKVLVVTAREEELSDANANFAFFVSMRAVIRYHHNKHWRYEGGERDSALYANLIEKLAAQVEQNVSETGALKSFPKESAKQVAQALMIDARILGIEGASDIDDVSNLGAMLAPASQQNLNLGDPNEWECVIQNATRSREEMIELLLYSISSRQGTTGGELAVDAAFLLDALRDLRQSGWEVDFDSSLPLGGSPSQTLRDHINRDLGKSLPKIVKIRTDSIKRWREEITESLGDSPDFREVVRVVKNTITLAKDAGCFSCGDLNAEQLGNQIKNQEKKLDSVQPTLKSAAEISEEGCKFDKSLSVLAQIDESTMEGIRSLLVLFGRFLKETKASVSLGLGDSPKDLEVVVKEFTEELDALSSSCNQINDLCQP